VAQLDERRNVRTRATENQLLDKWLDVAELESTTRRNYVSKLDKHVRPVLGRLPVCGVDAETRESLYAALRKWESATAAAVSSSTASPASTSPCRPGARSASRAVH
jgi:hypothetical protein